MNHRQRRAPRDVVAVATAASRAEAEIICGYLRDRGIPATFAADDEGGMIPALQITRSVRILVLAEHEEAARRSLDTLDGLTGF